ncbi:MAG: hypothetical protein CUN55_20220, partial [Phototrophicales bacterium]
FKRFVRFAQVKMGRIKTKLAKRYSRELMQQAEFTTDFQKNKQIIDDIAHPQSKKIRNVVAGYITRLAKSQQ